MKKDHGKHEQNNPSTFLLR